MADVSGCGVDRARARHRSEAEDAAGSVAPRTTERAASMKSDALFARTSAAMSRALPVSDRPRGAPPNPVDAFYASVLHPDRAFQTLGSLGEEVLRLRAIKNGEEALGMRGNPDLAAAAGRRAAELTRQWCRMAEAKGMSPPDDSFVPAFASDHEVRRAVLWANVANVYPARALAADGGDRYRNDVMTAWCLRSPRIADAFLARLVAADPARARTVLEGEVRRLGDRNGCKDGDTVASLLARRTELLGFGSTKANDASRSRLGTGLDGRSGNADALEGYDTEQYLLAMNPGTTFGGILASIAATRSGGDVSSIRASGAAGNAIESLGDGVNPTNKRATTQVAR